MPAARSDEASAAAESPGRPVVCGRPRGRRTGQAAVDSIEAACDVAAGWEVGNAVPLRVDTRTRGHGEGE